ncbi:MAG: cyclic nucleotide-binding domain-containing protein [Kiritimatiellae bacterium]|nr:cyclic nucleotide-binding domain-containing protein [Kiritimatiellia bacterium]
MAVDPKLRDQIGKLQPIGSLAPQRIEELMSACSVETPASGTTLFREGETDGRAVYVLSGTVQLSGKGADYSVTGGTADATYAIADMQPREVTAVAGAGTRVLRVPNDLLDSMINRTHLAQAEAEGEAARGKDKPKAGGLFGKLGGLFGGKKQKVDPAVGDWKGLVQQADVFKAVPPENLEGLLDSMEPMPVKAGDVLITQGDEGDYYYFIVKGTAVVSRQAEGEASAVPIAEIGAGTGFGEDALISNAKRNATVTMKTEGTLVRLSKEHFTEHLKAPILRWLSRAEAQKEISEGAKWLDVRQAIEFERARLPDAICIPLHELRSRASELDKSKLYICYCQNGRLSSTAAFLLRQLGIRSAVLRGGIRHLKGA